VRAARIGHLAPRAISILTGRLCLWPTTVPRCSATFKRRKCRVSLINGTKRAALKRAEASVLLLIGAPLVAKAPRDMQPLDVTTHLTLERVFYSSI